MGVVKRRVLQGLWRRLVGVGIIGTGLFGFFRPLYCRSPPPFLGRALLVRSFPPFAFCGPSLCPAPMPQG